MLPLLPGDLFAAVQVLQSVTPRRRRDLARRLVAEAALARAHVLRTGLAHPRLGCGTLTEAAGSHRPGLVMPVLDAEALDCLMLVLRALHPVVAEKTRPRALSA